MTLGSSQRKYSWHDAMIFISLVLNNFKFHEKPVYCEVQGTVIRFI